MIKEIKYRSFKNLFIIVILSVHFVKFGDSFNKETPPWVSPTNKIGSL